MDTTSVIIMITGGDIMNESEYDMTEVLALFNNVSDEVKDQVVQILSILQPSFEQQD